MFKNFIQSLRSDNHEEREEVEVCERCCTGEARHYCNKCEVYLCEECKETVHSMGAFTSHNISEIASR